MDIPEKRAPRLFLVDAYALIYRAFFAFVRNPLRNSRGENTSAPFGFANFLIAIREEHQPDYLAIVFDRGMSDREKLYPRYKATREKMPDELRESLPRIRALVEAFNDPVVEVDGYEADDVIGTLALKAREKGLESVIVSGDKDLYQLVGPGVHLLNPGRGGSSGVSPEWIDDSNASEKFGIPPSRIADYLALVGDTADNVPGAPGIGPKTAVKLLSEYGSLEELLERFEEIPGKRARESLRDNADMVRLSKKLVTIDTGVEIALDLDRLEVREPDHSRLRELFMKLEFRRLTDKYSELAGPVEEERAEYHLVSDPGEVKELVARIRAAGAVSIDTETTDIDPMRAELVGISVAVEPGEGYYLPFAHRPPSDPGLADDPAPEIHNLPPLHSEEMAPLVAAIEDPEVRKAGQNLKYDLIVFREMGIQLAGVSFDTMIASYVLDPGRRQHSLDTLSTDYLGHVTIHYEDVAGKGRNEIPFAEVPLDAACRYAAEDADIALRLKRRFERDLREKALEELFHELEMPLVPVLGRMERNGVRIDDALFEEMNERLVGDVGLVREEIFKVAGEEFNVNSTPQLRKILFEKMEMPVIKKTKTGPSTDVSVLEALASQGFDIPRLLIEYRQLEKLRNTYVAALPGLVNPKTGRIHTSYNQTVSATGRVSSSDPNLQNIPIRSDVGREIRKGFVPAEGHLFLGADYSQIELRIMAHFSGDEAFVTAFREGIDVHRQTAALIFGVDIDDITPLMRDRAKTINFATLYGQGAFSLGNQLGLTRDQAQSFIDDYFERFSGVRAFLDSQIAMANERGYVETLAGRRRQIPELKSSNWNVRQFGERVAQNTPIQGTAADLIKKAMIAIDDELVRGTVRGRMLLQVHDELVFEVPEADADALEEMVREKMEGAMELDVPLRVDFGRGRSWFECKG